MKYGANLKQTSVPAWSHNNIDYDEIKHFIKENTTSGSGKAVSIPGRGDEKAIAFENTLFRILSDEHERIDLFVKCKAGEIERRIDNIKKQVKRLSRRKTVGADNHIPVSRLEKYERLEYETLGVGEEIRCLDRFTSAQRTGFRKLLKKYQKWTGSENLKMRFRENVLDDPKGFTQFDFGPLLDYQTEVLGMIRSVYDSQKPNQQVDSRADRPGETAREGAMEARSNSSNSSRVSENPPFRSYREKKPRRTQQQQQAQTSQRYWSEYDNPEDLDNEDGNGGGDDYFIYLDPTEKNTFDRVFERIGNLFVRQPPANDEEALLSPENDVQSSSDEEDNTSYGTLTVARRSRQRPVATLALLSSVAALTIVTGGLLAWRYLG